MFSREINLEKLMLDEDAIQNGKSMRASHADFVQGMGRSKVTWQGVETTEIGTAPLIVKGPERNAECLN